ncbi:hypothetical protein V8E36_002802 [Tilletia maclaganii]
MRLLSVVAGVAATVSLSGALVSASSGLPASEERFDEDLLLRPLADGGVHAAFHFDIDSGAADHSSSSEGGDDDDGGPSWLAGGATESHFRLLPRSLIQIARAANTREFKLSIGAGSWRYSAWGEPTLDLLGAAGPAHAAASAGRHAATSKLWGRHHGARARDGATSSQAHPKLLGDDAVGNGAELWASFVPPPGSVLAQGEGPNAHDHARLSWRKLTSALAGLFCASLDTTLSPRVALKPSDPNLFSSSSARSPTQGNESLLLHAFAPSESICTENLTPFLKLLPCRSASAGLAQLLSPHALFSSAYHSLSVHVIKIDLADGAERWKVQLRVQAVYTAAKARLKGREAEELVLQPLFSRNITQACPLAASSNVYIPRPPRRSDSQPVDDDDDDEAEVPDEDVFLLDADASQSYEQPSWPVLHTIEPDSPRRRRSSLPHKRRSWRASPHTSSFSDIALRGLALAYDLSDPVPSESPALEIYRTHTSAHPTRGTFTLTLTNYHQSEPVRARYYDELPWWMQAWMHTLRVVKVEDVTDGSQGCNAAAVAAGVSACTASAVPESAGSNGRRSRSSSSASSRKEEGDDIVRFVDDFLCPPILAVHYAPSSGRDLSPDAQPGSGRPSLLELDVRVPASSRVKMQMEYDLAFLRYTEHPPGPQKGWGVPPGLLLVLGSGTEGAGQSSSAEDQQDSSRWCPVDVPRPRPGQQQRSAPPQSLPPLPHPIKVGSRGVQRRVYTEAALIELAVPDFSMIYNLILFTSTEIALFFGSMFNLLVRRFGDVAV